MSEPILIWGHQHEDFIVVTNNQTCSLKKSPPIDEKNTVFKCRKRSLRSFRFHEFYEYETEQGFVTFFLNCYIQASKQDPLNQGAPISGT